MHVVNSRTCSCSFWKDALHYFLGCPLFAIEREKLVNTISQLTEVTLHKILFGNKILSFEDNCKKFCAVHEFIESNGRF